MVALKNRYAEEAEFSEAEIKQMREDCGLDEPVYNSKETRKILKQCRTTYHQRRASGELEGIYDGRSVKHTPRQIAVALLRMLRRAQGRRAAA